MKYTIAITIVYLNVALAAVLPLKHQPTQEQSKKISAWKIGDPGYPWEMSGQYQGDMRLSQNQKNGVIDENLRWPNRTLVYEFDESVDEYFRYIIRLSMEYYNNNTCVRAVERTTETDYVYVTQYVDGCWSDVGRQGGKQNLNLEAPGCMWGFTILHEFLHAFGFYHMQSASDRDDYVEIYTDNILAGKEHNFFKYSSSVVDNFGELYDYKSVMHYSETAFTSNGWPTIKAKDGTSPLGNFEGLTERDRNKLHRMYGCPL